MDGRLAPLNVPSRLYHRGVWTSPCDDPGRRWRRKGGVQGVGSLTRRGGHAGEQRLLVDYMSSYDPTRCTAVDTAPYTGGSSGGFIATHNENHTYFMVDGQNATVTYRYRPRLDLLTYESHLPQQHLGAMFTDARDGVSYQLVRSRLAPRCC